MSRSRAIRKTHWEARFPALVERIADEEGYRPAPYRDSRGILTIGYGHNLEAGPVRIPHLAWYQFGEFSARCPDEVRKFWRLTLEAEVRLAERLVELQLEGRGVEETVTASGRRVSVVTHSRREALIEMCYQLGPKGLAGFKKMWDAISAGEWRIAAAEALDSRWATQTPARAERVAARLRDED